MNTEQVAKQVLDNIINDLKYAFGLDQEMAERVACTVIRYPKMAMELQETVKNKRMLGR